MLQISNVPMRFMRMPRSNSLGNQDYVAKYNTQSRSSAKNATQTSTEVPKGRVSRRTSAPLNTELAADLPLNPAVKTWVNAARMFTPPARSKLAYRQMGVVEKSLAYLSYYGLSTNIVRVLRMRSFLLEHVMVTALQVLQETRPELLGTLNLSGPKPPVEYSDTFSDLEELEENLEEEAEKEKTKKPAQVAEEEQMPVKLPKTLMPITLDVVEEADSKTFLGEVTNLLNVPFGRGVPLLRVRLVRHPGGTDLLLAGHQCLFDEASFDTLCSQVLDFYDMASEGRLKGAPTGSYPMLSSIDSLYPASLRAELNRMGSFLYSSVELYEIAKQADWKHLPYAAGTQYQDTPALLAPALTSTAVMFGQITEKQTETLYKACTKKEVHLNDLMSAAVTRAMSSIISREEALPQFQLPQTAKESAKTKNSKSPQQTSPNPPVSLLVAHVHSLRQTFEPPIPSAIIGSLNSYLIAPMHDDLKEPIAKMAKRIGEERKAANLQQTTYSDIALLPALVDMCSSETKWNHPSVPIATISEATFSMINKAMRLRYQIYDSKCASSCWVPGISTSIQYTGNQLGVSLSYRKPLISEKTAHEILHKTLLQLTSL